MLSIVEYEPTANVSIYHKTNSYNSLTRKNDVTVSCYVASGKSDLIYSNNSEGLPFITCYVPDKSKKHFKTVLDFDKVSNLRKLSDIEALKDNWNENGAIAIPKELINKVRHLIFELNIQPEIFPLTDGQIQFEYEKGEKYMEINLKCRGKNSVTIIDEYSEKKFYIQNNYKDINRVVRDFYG